jgi:uncharacterized protein (DUF2252 family)
MTTRSTERPQSVRKTAGKTATTQARKTETTPARKTASTQTRKTATTPPSKAPTTPARKTADKTATTPARKRTPSSNRSDGQAPLLTPEERAKSGKAARGKTPLEAHADFTPAKSRDPIKLLLSQAETRVPDLVPIRHGRMLVSPFTFYRGAAIVMAADLQSTSMSGLRTQLCGDAHLSNFGVYASPERRLVFDINDFDETLPGPFEWDIKRLAASFVVAGRDNGFSRKQYRRASLAAVESYRTAIRDFAAQPILTVWYAHLEMEQAIADYKASLSTRQLKERKARIKATEGALAKARTRDSLQAIGKLTTLVNGKREITKNPPLIVPLRDMIDLDPDQARKQITALLASYRKTLQSDRRVLIDHFELADIAHKVVGVGSVGTRAWILLLESGVEAGGLLLQAKEAGPSALADYAGKSAYTNQGERVVAGQHLMQASSDIFLGWLRARGIAGQYKDYYLRQLRDWKMSAVIEEMIPSGMEQYARWCGWTLARAHARAGDRIAIAAYLGKSTNFDNAVADFAEAYADQNERDRAALADAVKAGKVEAQSGV